MSIKTPLPNNRRWALQERSEEISTTTKPWREWLRMVNRVLLTVAILTAGVAGALAARRYITTSSRFALRDFEVRGNKRFTKEQIARIAGVTINQNVVNLDRHAIQTSLERNPWIEHALVTRRLPNSLSIELQEREAALLVALPTGVFLSTAQGHIFKKLEEGDPSDLPVITGIQLDDVEKDRDAIARILRNAIDLVSEIEKVGLYQGRVEEIYVDFNDGLTAVMNRQALRIVFGAGPYRVKVRTAVRIERELQRRRTKPTVIFLDDDLHSDRIVVRLVSALPDGHVTID